MQAVLLVPTVETLCLALFDIAAQNLLLVYFFLKLGMTESVWDLET